MGDAFTKNNLCANEKKMSKIPNKRSDEIKTWLNAIDANNCEVVIEEESCSSVVESSIIETDSSESGEELDFGGKTNDIQFNKCGNILPHMNALTFNNINISNSSNVYLGHVYKVNGNLNINVISNEEMLYEDNELKNKEISQQEKSPVLRHACRIFPRHRWLAMDPLSESRKILEPVEFVIIGYTATTSSTQQAKNIGIIRDFQTLNVEAQGFNDIIYNFLIGCDGVVYEGRGWGVEGDHTSGYNHRSIGVGFVGNFKHNVPTQRTLKACQNLFTRGLAEGHLSKNCKILSSCQFSDNKNDALYEELKKFEHFWGIESSNEY